MMSSERQRTLEAMASGPVSMSPVPAAAGRPAMTVDAAADLVRPARRPTRVRPWRRSLLVRLARPLAMALLIVGVPVSTAAWVGTAPPFALGEIVIEDAAASPKVAVAWVRATVARFAGANLPRLPLSAVEAEVLAHPWVAAVDLRKDLPDRLVVEVREKRAAALYRLPDEGRDTLVYLDERGQPIAPWSAGDGEVDLPMISGPAPGGDLRCAVDMVAEIAAVAPSWAAGLSEIEILGEKDFRVYSADLPFPLLVRAGTLKSKNHRLEQLLPQVTSRFARIGVVDLRFARRIIVQPEKGSDG